MPISAAVELNLQVLTPFDAPDQAVQLSVKIAPNQTIARGTVIGELTVSPRTYAPYISTNTDGTQIPKGLLAYDVQTDALGNILLTQLVAQLGPQTPVQQSVGMFYRGIFSCADLHGMDANAQNLLHGVLAQGTLQNGIIAIG